MPEEKNCKLLQLDQTTEQKQKQKKKKKTTKSQKSSGSTDSADKRQSASEPPAPPSPPQGPLPRIKTPRGKKKTAERLGKKTSKKSPGLQESETPREGPEEARDPESRPRVPARDTLRWEGVLQDPQAEAQRLEQYRADRRLRYIGQREALLRATVRTELLDKDKMSAGPQPEDGQPVLSKSRLK